MGKDWQQPRRRGEAAGPGPDPGEAVAVTAPAPARGPDTRPCPKHSCPVAAPKASPLKPQVKHHHPAPEKKKGKSKMGNSTGKLRHLFSSASLRQEIKMGVGERGVRML